MANILVVGGAGYIGSTFAYRLRDQGIEFCVLDDLSTGHPHLLPSNTTLVQARAGNREQLRNLFANQNIDCVLHFAAKALVSESVANPKLYQEYNVEDTRVLLEEMRSFGINKFVFSSSCAVYGNPQTALLTETSPKQAVNPYGQSKWDAEELIRSFCQNSGLNAVILRYFNAAGAEAQLRTGEWHDPETHLIPNLIKASLDGKTFEVFGDKYPTLDGSCIRDFIHVSDLATYHVWAMEALERGQAKGSLELNLGTGRGLSVLEIIDEWTKLYGVRPQIKMSAPRAGDPPVLVADASKAHALTGIRPKYGIGEILQSAWDWEGKLRKEFLRS